MVGKEAYQAEEIIKQDNDELQIEVIEEGVPIAPNFEVQRVRILLNDQGKVKQIPRIGWFRIHQIYYIEFWSITHSLSMQNYTKPYKSNIKHDYV